METKIMFTNCRGYESIKNEKKNPLLPKLSLIKATEQNAYDIIKQDQFQTGCMTAAGMFKVSASKNVLVH